MAVPRTMIILSFVVIISLLTSSIWLALEAMSFQEDLEELFPKNTVTEAQLQEDGRWAWEIDLLFDTCDSRLDDWEWPDSLSEQDDVFLYLSLIHI